MDYKTYVSQLKIKARNIFRTKAVARFIKQIFAQKKDIKENNKTLTTSEKYLAVAEYNLNKIDTKHPDAEEMTKTAEDNVKANKEELEKTKTGTEKANKESEDNIKELEEKIEKIEKGETPIGIDKINEKVQEWLDDVKPDDFPEEFEGSGKPATTDEEDEETDNNENNDEYTPENIN